MKKILLFVLVALVLVALVACGETTTATTTTNTPGSTSGQPGGSTPGSDEGNTPGGEVDPDYKPLYNQGIDIFYGPDPNWWAIDPYAFDQQPVMFEDHHQSLDYEWAMIFRITESAEMVYDDLFPALTDEETGTTERKPNPLYQWTIKIDDTEIPITKWANAYGDTTCDYARVGLGDWKPVEGEHTYKISIKITLAGSEEIVYWANLADENFGGGYYWNRPAKMGIVADPTVPNSVEMLAGSDKNYLEGLAGPGTSGTETYVSLFDYNVNSKLCTNDSATAIVFMVSEKVTDFTIKGMSIMGANDDDPYTGRVPKKFALYGTNEAAADPAADYWKPVLSVDEETVPAVNYGERYFDLTTESSYRYYMLVLDESADEDTTYQFSEIIFYVTKGEWAVTE